MQNFEQLLGKFSEQDSLQRGNNEYIRYNAYTTEGENALNLYEIGVALMKERSFANQGDPFGWDYQAGIHGTFWGNLQGLASWAEQYNYEFTSEEDILSGNTVLNNCTHYNDLWSGIALAPGTDMEVNFLPWHRLYLQNFESIIRELLSQEGIAGAENWALPYWEYTNPSEGVIPTIFRDQNSPLFEYSRGVRINNGESMKDLEVLSTIQEALKNSLEQSTYQSFNTTLDANPHGFMHDVLGGEQDSNADKLKIGAAQQATADRLGAGDGDAINREMGLMGNVASAALDPIFWIHHSYIDKIWSDWNSTDNATYINEFQLRNNPWDYQYFSPSSSGNGTAEINATSYWGDDPKAVMSEIYNPNYSYDDSYTSGNTPNPVLSLIQHPAFNPIAVKKKIEGPLQKVNSNEQELTAISLDLPLNYADISELNQKNSINLEVNLDYAIPMNESTPFRVVFWDMKTLSDSTKLTKLLSNFELSELPGFTVVPFPMGGEQPSENDGMDGGMMHDGMQNKMSMASHNMMMPMGASIDLTHAFQIKTDVLDSIGDSPLGMIAISSDSNNQISIKELSISLNQNLNQTNINGNTFDNAAYLAEYPELLKNPAALADPYAYFQTIGKTQGDLPTTIEDRAEELGFGYLAANPDLVIELNNSPYQAIENYLDTGLKEGRTLIPTSAQSDDPTDSIIGPQAFRLFNGESGDHLTSANSSEIYFLLANKEGWRNEGPSFEVGAKAADQSIFRFIDQETGGYYYSRSEETPNDDEFLLEGLAFEIFSDSSNKGSERVALIQYYDESSGQYLLSSSTDEQRILENDDNWIKDWLLGYVNPLS